MAGIGLRTRINHAIADRLRHTKHHGQRLALLVRLGRKLEAEALFAKLTQRQKQTMTIDHLLQGAR